MLKFHIKDYEDFKSVFGTCKSTRGCIQNRVLLDFWKTRFKIDGDGRASAIRNVQDLYTAALKALNGHRPKEPYFLKSNSYQKLDEYGSYEKKETYQRCIPEINVNFKLGTTNYRFFCKNYSNPRDGLDALSVAKTGVIHLYNNTNCRHEDVKAGRFLKRIMEDNNFKCGEPTELYLAEEFQRKVDEATTFDGNYELVVDKHFDWIYSSDKCHDSFGSCMCDKGRTSFYTDCVDADAIYILRKSDNKIVARAILYHNVYSKQDGKLHDYIDRTYGIDESMKRLLTHKAIAEGKADLYKAVGAGCRDIYAIMDKDGNRLANAALAINMYLTKGHKLSFADTFKYYDYANGVASNATELLSSEYQDGLDHTSETWGGNSCKIKKNEVFSRTLSSFFSK